MKHLPECPNYEGPCCPWMGDCDCQCLCDILSACENRMKKENALTYFASETEAHEQLEAYFTKALNIGYEAALNDIREVVLEMHPRCEDDCELCDEWDQAIAAIDSLKVRSYLADNLSNAYNEDGYKIDPNCKHEDTWFSREFCYCIPDGDMHTICSDCGLTWLGEDRWGVCG